ncbi:MAG: conjugal transfer protein TraF [Gammaproteobacteria bacterium]|nr:conjugal transfer protein TraF [Gammaproteobacteria bacterium]
MANAFNAFDPKSLAMGGTGVAMADPATSPFYNPALLSVAEQSDDFSLEFPVFGGSVTDENEFVDTIDGTEDLVDALDTEINNYNNIVNPGAGAVAPMVNAINDVNSKLADLTDRPISLDGGLGIIVAIPSEKFGMAFTANGRGYGAGSFSYEDGQTVTDFTDDMTALDACNASADPITCITTTSFNYVDTNPLSPTFGEVVFDTDNDIQSNVRTLGVATAEVGLSFSREFFILGQNLAVGITPKMVSTTVIDYTASAQSFDSGDDDIDDFSETYDDFNIDVGIAKDHMNGFRTGLVIKNLIGYDYETVNPNATEPLEISIEPQLRAGVSYQNSFSTIALDVDLTKNDALSLIEDASTQYASLGIELNAFDFTQIRAGYRMDMENSDRNQLSVGFGLSPLGFHVDLAVVVGEEGDSGGFAFQLGFRI